MVPMRLRRTAVHLCYLAGFLLCPGGVASAAELTASELAAALGAAAQDGNSVARARFKIQPEDGGAPAVLQVQIKSRRTPERSEAAYAVLWPADRKGEAFVVRQDMGSVPVGFSVTLPDRENRLDPQRLQEGAFGSDLSYRDAVENFFLWSGQALAGRENEGKVDCIILESKPGAKDSSAYSRVRSWIDPRRMIAMRVEKFDRQGRLACRIDTTQVAKDDIGRHVPAALTVRRTGSGTVTEIEGSNLRHDARIQDADFTREGLPAVTGSR